MATLADYTNVFNTALSILEQKGYQLWYDAASYTYYAEKNGWDFASNSPVGLLGVIAIYEFHKPNTWAEYWWLIPREGSHRDLPSAPQRAYEPVYKKRE